jgi:hypothetical protein
MIALVLLFAAAAPSSSDAAPLCAACDEAPSDVEARVRYERALRAELDGRRDDALREAQACLEARPAGRFAEPARALIVRARNAPPQARGAGIGPRTELVISSTLAGVYLSSLTAAALDADGKGATGLVMLGTGGGLVASILATSGRRVPDSMPQMLFNGLAFGTYATLLVRTLADNGGSGRSIAGAAALGAAVGGTAGLLSSVYVPGGDAAAISTGMVWGGLVPLLIEGAIAPHVNTNAPLWTLLIGSTAGVIIGPVLNHQLRYSRGRWNLISLGGGVGLLMGAGLGVLTDAFNGEGRAGLTLSAAGSIAGLGLMALLTKDFDFDDARPGSASLLHLEGGKLSAGSFASAVSPIRVHDRTGPYLRVLEGNF